MAENLQAPVYSQTKEPVGQVELPPAIFGQTVRVHLLHETVKMQLANRRRGTHATKTRAFVSGGGKKPWKQKGTGRARAGSSRSPVWVGGASVFGPQPRDYSYRIPASARRQALCAALSAKHQEGRLLVVDRLEVATGKTKDLVRLLDTLGAASALMVIAAGNDLLARAAGNLPHVRVLPVAGLNVFDVLRYEKLILTSDALKSIEERLSA